MLYFSVLVDFLLIAEQDRGVLSKVFTDKPDTITKLPLKSVYSPDVVAYDLYKNLVYWGESYFNDLIKADLDGSNEGMMIDYSYHISSSKTRLLHYKVKTHILDITYNRE